MPIAVHDVNADVNLYDVLLDVVVHFGVPIFDVVLLPEDVEVGMGWLERPSACSHSVLAPSVSCAPLLTAVPGRLTTLAEKAWIFCLVGLRV